MSDVLVTRLEAALGGRYRIERELGRGGMAIVYLAHDDKHRRPVAIKVLRPELAEAMGKERFTREIEVAAGLNHPNILGLHDSGEADGLTYFVMPFVEGESLREVLDRKGTLSLEVAIRYATEMANALSYAHEHDLVHRDVKPENVLLQAGHAIVCDFGIAKAVSDVKDNLTRTGTSVGTIAYMSPEQLSDDGPPVDGRSDLYGVASVLYEMLEGEPPFSASSSQASMAKKLVGELPASSSRSTVPLSVWEVMCRALATNPADRFETADDFAAALNRATTDFAVQRAKGRHRRRRVGRILAGAAVVAAIGFGGWWVGGMFEAVQYDRIVVLPLENGAGVPGEEFYVRGVHEDLVEEMQRAGLRVINATSARNVAEQGGSIAEIAELLGVDAVIQGSVQRIGPRVSLELTLSDGSSEELVWQKDDYSYAHVDVARMIGDATLDVAEHIGAQLTPEAQVRLAAAAEVDPVLYELLLQARFEVYKLSAEGFAQAERYYERAVARDSMSADAWTGLASLPGFRAQQGFIDGADAVRMRDEILARAPIAELVPDRGQLALQMTWVDWPQARWEEAEEAFLAALEEKPGDATTRGYYAQYLMYRDRDQQAERECSRAAIEAPDDPLVQSVCAQVLIFLHRYQDAENALNHARRFDPDSPYLLSTLRTTHHLMGRYDLAIESWRDSYRTSGADWAPEALEALNRGYDEGGYHAGLRAVAEFMEQRRTEQLELPPGQQTVRAWQVGTLYTRAGVQNKAIEYLELALDAGDPNSPSVITDPIFDPFRDDPRFQALVDRLRLPG